MRILLISDVYFPRINGVSTSIQTFSNEFQKHGHEVTLIAPAYGDGGEWDVDVIRVPSRRVLFDPEDRMMVARHIMGLTERLRQQRFDLLHIQTPFVAHYTGVALSRHLGVPCVESYHTYFEEYLYHYVPFAPKSWMQSVARRFSAKQCNSIDAVIVPSNAMERVLRGYGVHTRMEVVPTGIECHRFSGGDGDHFRRRHGIRPGRPTLVNIGRIAHEKNIEFLLHVLANIRRTLPGILLIIAGEGPALKHLRQRVVEIELGDNVLFVGYLSREKDLLDCYRAGDVFVFASRTETQGLVLLEAMALGVPVVSTAHMGTVDILRAGRGALVAKESVEDFTAKILRLLRDPPLRTKLGHEAVEYARSWSASSLARDMLGFYREVIASRPGIND